MALIPCSECGRSVSDKATACVGCGAPIHTGIDTDANAHAAFAIAPEPSKSPPLTHAALRWRALLAAVTFISGLIMTIRVDHQGGSRSLATLAALLLVSGLCWLIVAILQNVMALRGR
jgi:hypothetical protein